MENTDKIFIGGVLLFSLAAMFLTFTRNKSKIVMASYALALVQIIVLAVIYAVPSLPVERVASLSRIVSLILPIVIVLTMIDKYILDKKKQDKKMIIAYVLIAVAAMFLFVWEMVDFCRLLF